MLTVTYRPGLVLLSIGVAILGSLAALALTSRADTRTLGWQRRFALVNGGLVMGSTIWSMHFIAMMAVDFPVIVNYDLVDTVASIALAVLATGIGLYLTSGRKLGQLSIPAGGVLMGLGIAGMHYAGMGAIRGCGLAYDTMLVAVSIAVAICASTAALWLAFARRGFLMTLAGGVVQGLAIASMHYTAMAATSFVLLSVAIEVSEPLFSQGVLALMIACGVALVSISTLAIVRLMSMQSPGLLR